MRSDYVHTDIAPVDEAAHAPELLAPGATSAVRAQLLPAKRVLQSQWIVLITVAAFAWRMYRLTYQSPWRDEVDAIFLAVRPLSETLSMFISPAQNGPLYFLVLRAWLSLAGASYFALRYLSVLAGVLSIVILWQVARRLLPGDGQAGLSNIPLLATLLFAFNPYQVWYGQEGKMYTLVMCLTLLAAWSWLEAIRHGGGRRWLRYFAITSISIYTHLMTALMIPLHIVWFLIAWPHSRRQWKGYLAALAGLTLPYLPLVWWQWHYLTSPSYNSGFRFVPLGEMIRSLLLGYSRGLLPTQTLYWLVPIFFLLLVGALMGGSGASVQQDPTNSSPVFLSSVQRWAILLSWLVAPVALIFGVSLLKPVYVDRYVIWIMPAFVMLLAMGIHIVRQNSGRWARPMVVALIVYVMALWLIMGWRQVHSPIKTQLREAVGFVAERRQPGELLIMQIPHNHYAYRYFTSDFGPDPFENSDARLAPWTEGIWTQNGLPDDAAMAEVDAIMQEKTAGYQDVWVILSEAEMWDGRRLMDRWLDSHGVLAEQQTFYGVEVRHYVLR
jgi:4-amino-4-deoxy-L-arabinose transferase-like glycosyltransferase